MPCVSILLLICIATQRFECIWNKIAAVKQDSKIVPDYTAFFFVHGEDWFQSNRKLKTLILRCSPA